MQNSINFYHDERKILTSFDNILFIKENNKWVEETDIDVYKGEEIPDDNIGKDNDLYFYYDRIGNLLINSENFYGAGWINLNNSFNMDEGIFPYSNYYKMIPNQTFSEHSLSYKIVNQMVGDMPYWCFSIYIRPNEYNYFQLIMSDYAETTGIKATFSRFLNGRKKYEIAKEIEAFGETEGEIIYDDECFDMIEESDGFYRVYISAKFMTINNIQFKLKLLRNENGNIKEVFANNNDTAGLFINAAQLSKTKKPIEYIKSDENPFSYLKMKSIFKKINNNWQELPEYITVYYGKDLPVSNLGQTGDIYFHNPIIKVGEFVRFGKNTLFKCWENGSNLYYTEYEEPSIGDDVYQYTDKPIKVGKITSYTKSLDNTPSKITFNSITATKNTNKDKRFITEPGVFFWNKDKNTYGYISNDNEVHNLSYNGKSLYDFDLINQALAFSVNLFNQTWNTKYSTTMPQYQMGYNSGGHGNFWDYNSLRKYY